MAIDDRDRKFEKALANQLRSREVQDSFAKNSACPDAEILAAYHERSLLLEELASWKNHITSCPRCQEILAQLEITEEIPVAAAAVQLEKETLLSAAGVRVPQAAYELRMPAAPAQIRAAANTAKSEPLPVTALRPRQPAWRWIAPAGAIAAGLLVWVAVHEKATVHSPQSPQTEIALNRAPEPAPPAATGSDSPANIPPQPPADAKKVLSRERDSAKPAYTSGGFSNPPPKLGATAVAAPPPAPPMLNADSALDTGSLEQGGVVGNLKQRAAPRPPSQPGNAISSRAALAGAALGTHAKTPSPSGGPAPGPADKLQQQQQQQQADAAVSAATETVEVTAAAPREYRMVGDVETLRNLPRITAPDGHTIWMIGPRGFVQRSEDGGRTWKVQKSRVSFDLRAGAAPSQKICWLVGSAGVVLRTTDGGKNWEKRASPIENDLGAVNATDELHATVTDAANKTSFVTDDGGKTWTPVAGQ